MRYLASTLIVCILSLFAVLFPFPFRQGLVWAQSEWVCGQFVLDGTMPFFVPYGSNERWLIDNYLDIFFSPPTAPKAPFARILKPIFGPDFEGGKYLVGYSEVKYLSSCEPSISFWADRNPIVQGECTTIRWVVDNVEAVYLDGQGVIGSGEHLVCPVENTTYTLRVVSYIGDMYPSVTINVVWPTPTPVPPTATPIPPTSTPSLLPTPPVPVPGATPVPPTLVAQVPTPSPNPFAWQEDNLPPPVAGWIWISEQEYEIILKNILEETKRLEEAVGIYDWITKKGVDEALKLILSKIAGMGEKGAEKAIKTKELLENFMFGSRTDKCLQLFEARKIAALLIQYRGAPAYRFGKYVLVPLDLIDRPVAKFPYFWDVLTSEVPIHAVVCPSVSQPPETMPTGRGWRDLTRGGGIVTVDVDSTLNMRSQPSLQSKVVHKLQRGEKLQLVGDPVIPVIADGYTWWNVELVSDPSVRGWCANSFLRW
jgi:hypothetical protein